MLLTAVFLPQIAMVFCFLFFGGFFALQAAFLASATSVLTLPFASILLPGTWAGMSKTNYLNQHGHQKSLCQIIPDLTPGCSATLEAHSRKLCQKCQEDPTYSI